MTVIERAGRGNGNIAGWFAAAFVLGATLLLTLKGSGLLAFAGGALTMAIYFAPRLTRQMQLAILGLVLLGLILTVSFIGPISERTAFLIQREQGDSRSVGRLDIWASILPAYAQRPLLGYGMGNSPTSGEVLRTMRFGAFGTNPVSPESGYLQVLVETGAVGFLGLLTFFGITCARAARLVREKKDAAIVIGILSALVALWAGNLTVSAFTTDQNGMLMGLLIGLVYAKWNVA